MTGEGEIRRARASYVEGLIELDEFEERVEDVVFGRWSPTSLMAAALKETWSDYGSYQVIHSGAAARERHLVGLRQRLDEK